jgi:hypothetical protein
LTDQQSLRDVILFPAMRKLTPGGHKGEDSPPE